jgi:hypothetical protein
MERRQDDRFKKSSPKCIEIDTKPADRPVKRIENKRRQAIYD